MTILFKALIYITSVLAGVVIGFWFVGSFLDYRITIDGIPVSSVSSDEFTRRVIKNPKALQSTTTLVFNGQTVVASDGPWLMYGTILLSTIVFGLAGHVLTKRTGGRHRKRIS